MDINLAKDIIDKALIKGADSAEVYISRQKGASVEVKDGKVDALQASDDFDISLRIFRKGRLGFSFTTDISEADKVVDNAIESSRWPSEDEFNLLPDMKEPSEVSIYDKNIAVISEDELISSAVFLEDSALSYDNRIKKVRKAEVSAGVSETTIANSMGIGYTYESSYMSAQIVAFAEDGKESQIGSDYAVKRRASDIDLSSIAVNAAQGALNLLGSRNISAIKLPILLPPEISVEFLEVLSVSFSADAVQKQRSLFADRIGLPVAGSLVNIIDDGTLAWGSGSSPVDDEGVPSQKKILISEGLLQGYIHNTCTANKGATLSTGNALRASRGLPGVGITNMYIKPDKGDADKNSIIKSLSKGLLITGVMGVHMANPVSGDFSIGISGLVIEGGEALYPFKEAVISGNLLDMFKRVEQVGSDLQFYGSIGSPSLLIGEMDVSA